MLLPSEAHILRRLLGQKGDSYWHRDDLAVYQELARCGRTIPIQKLREPGIKGGIGLTRAGKLALRLFELGACAALLAGCAAPYSAPTSYQVHLDASLPADASLAVVDAAEAWSQALPELRIAVMVDACSGDETTICVSAGVNADPDIMGSTVQTKTTMAVTLNLDNIAGRGASIEQTALHELGHGMGLHHHAPGTVMAAEQNEQATWPTADDVAQFRSR